MNFPVKNRLGLIFAITSLLLYISFAYDLVREDFIKLITLYGALFFFYIKIVKLYAERFGFLLVLSLIFRLIFIWAEPNLSQDYFRFIWDGRMLAQGLNPYISLPETFAQSGEFPIAQGAELYAGMGALNGSHYTIYPPFNQFVFGLAALFSPNSIFGAVVTMRILLILFDLGIIWVGAMLMKKLEMPQTQIFWYALNPFIIIETIGNLHFEGMMIFFLLLSVWMLKEKKWAWTAIFLAFSALVKLITFIFLPLFVKYWGWKKSILFYGLTLVAFLLFYLPFYQDGFIDFHLRSLQLYFSNFEFNASLYNLVRWIGFEVEGYNIIKTVGKYSPFVVISMVMLVSFLRKNKKFNTLIHSFLLVITLYYFSSTTVHPWYLALPLVLSLFTTFRYVLHWTLVVMLSYFTYSQPGFKENYYLLAVEYVLVYTVFIKEWIVLQKAGR